MVNTDKWPVEVLEYMPYTNMKDEALTHDGSKDEHADQVTHNSEHISEK